MVAEEARPTESSAQSHVSPQVTQLKELWRPFYDILPTASFEKIAHTAGFNEAIAAAVYLAQIEELRVRRYVAESDGVCLDSEEERSRFLSGLYGAWDNTDDDKGRMSPKYTPYEELRRLARENIDWPYGHEVEQFYRRAPEVAARFYTDLGDWEGDLPPVVFGVENLRNKNTLAAYNLIPDSVGIPFKITFNEQHYIEQDGQMVWRFGEWAKLETLVHEMGHHWQQIRGEDPFTPKSKVTHNKEFTDKMTQIGISCDSNGAHFAPVVVESPAGILFASWGLKPPEDVPVGEPLEFDWFKWFADKKGRARPGRSTLHKWECPECGLKVRYGRKDDPHLVHEPCGALLVRG